MPAHDAPFDTIEPLSAAASPGAAQLEQRLQAALHELDVLRREQQALARGLSHDLHGPLRAIDSFAWLLERKPQLDDEGRDQLRRVREAAARMTRLLERLQLFVHAGIAPLRLQDVDLSLLVEWSGAELHDAGRAQAIQLTVQPGLRAHGDERLLRLLLTELLDNACRHSPGPARIEVTGEPATNEPGTNEPGTNGIALHVRDHGNGFDMTTAARLGEPFQRLHADDSGGSGLGLAIAHRVVARHGGTLGLDSAPGVGTTAAIFLPASP